jgi:hypothetical protein
MRRAALAALLAALALSACGWGPVAWLAAHTALGLKREARTVLQAATSSPPSAPVAPAIPGVAASPELPAIPGAPASYQLATSVNVNFAEPGAGYDTNYPLTSATNAANGTYFDPYFATLCGPGAVAIALSYWPPAPHRSPNASVSDPLPGSGANAAIPWSDLDIDGVTRMRAYMLRLAYQTRVPGWSQAGMLPQSYQATGIIGGATLQVVGDTLNWEASGEDRHAWSDYFYQIQWNSDYYDRRAYPINLYQALHADIVTDLTRYHTPVIVEITAGYLPNWRDANPVNHFVVITGYDDAAGTYTYLDTCKEYTGCNTGGSDAPSLHTADQLQLSAGVANIATSGATGDGGWVW